MGCTRLLCPEKGWKIAFLYRLQKTKINDRQWYVSFTNKGWVYRYARWSAVLCNERRVLRIFPDRYSKTRQTQDRLCLLFANDPMLSTRFKRALDLILTRFKWKAFLLYLDDVIFFSNNVDDHIRHFVLNALTDDGVTLKINKCHFF